MKLKVQRYNAYGREFFYPADSITKDFLSTYSHSKNLQKKSFSKTQIEQLKKLGFKVEILESKLPKIK